MYLVIYFNKNNKLYEYKEFKESKNAIEYYLNISENKLGDKSSVRDKNIFDKKFVSIQSTRGDDYLYLINMSKPRGLENLKYTQNKYPFLTTYIRDTKIKNMLDES